MGVRTNGMVYFEWKRTGKFEKKFKSWKMKEGNVNEDIGLMIGETK